MRFQNSEGAFGEQKLQYQPEATPASFTDHMVQEKTSTYCYQKIQGQYAPFHFWPLRALFWQKTVESAKESQLFPRLYFSPIGPFFPPGNSETSDSPKEQQMKVLDLFLLDIQTAKSKSEPEAT